MKHQPALLQWVLVNNEIQHVSTFAHLKPKQRPIAICPECQEPVIMKLGSQKVHHVAHSYGSDCVLTNPESALHYNCKMYVARQLKKSAFLKLKERCDYCYSNEREIIWQEDWDEVKVERRLSNGLQPDVVLWKNNQPLAGIEIFVTHEVDLEKAKGLKKLHVPWIEIKGQSSLYLGDTAWQATQPIPADKTSWEISWKCDECIQRDEERLKQLEWERNNGSKPIRFRLIDWYFPYGKWLRCLFTINKVLKDGQIVSFNLSYIKTGMNYERIKYFDETCYTVEGFDNSLDEHEAVKALIKVGKNYLSTKREKHDLLFDSRMPWINGDPGHFERFDDHYFPRRYFFNRKTEEWFIPKDKKDEVWYEQDGTPIYRELNYWHKY